MLSITKEEVVTQMAREDVKAKEFNFDLYYCLANGNCWRVEYYLTGWTGWTAVRLGPWYREWIKGNEQ